LAISLFLPQLSAAAEFARRYADFQFSPRPRQLSLAASPFADAIDAMLFDASPRLFDTIDACRHAAAPLRLP